MVPNRDVRDILRKYGNKMGGKIYPVMEIGKEDYSQSYIKLKNEMAPVISI